MNRINELIKKLCPNGVEYHELKDNNLFKFYYGKGNKIPEDIGGKYDVYGANGVVSHINEYNCEDVSIIGHIGAVGMVNRCKGKCFVTYNGTIAEVVDKSKVDSQYLYYVLTTLNLPSFKKGSQPFLSVSDFDKIKIAVPPLEVQCEIVRILDDFTLLSSELSTELKAREKQYEYYRRNLLTFENDTKFIELKDLFNTKNGYTPSKRNKEYWEDGTISWYRMEDIRENGRILSSSIQKVNKKGIKGTLFPKNSIIISTSATIGEHAIITEDFLCNQRFTCLTLKDCYKNDYDIKFLFYYCYLLSEWCLNNLNQGNFASVDMKLFNKFKFPMIELDKQKKIVNILEKLDKLCNDTSEGIPAEIEARRKQFEHYRDKLLAFKELVNEG